MPIFSKPLELPIFFIKPIMPIFSKPVERSELVPPGLYILKVRNVEHSISTGAKTRGCDVYTITHDIQLSSDQMAWCFDRLIDAESTAWRINSFAVALGFDCPDGVAYEIAGGPNVNGGLVLKPWGLRCWAVLDIETFTTRANTEAKKNVVRQYILAPTPQQLAQLNDPQWGKRPLTPPTKGPVKPTEVTEDDVPF